MSYCEISHPKARKRHICDWCRGFIEKNEQYTLYEGVDDNEHFRTKLHEDCAEAVRTIPAGEDEDYEEVWGHAAQIGRAHV